MKEFVVLYDYDSMIYLAAHRIASISDIRGWFKEKRSRSWMEKEILNLALNRLANMSDRVLFEIEDTGVLIESVEYFLTVCPESVRKAKYPEYKGGRKMNKWVNMVRNHLIKMDVFVTNPMWEADDLIKDRSVELKDEGFIICSIDKDLKQIAGIHYDYYRPILKDDDGNRLTDEYGNRVIAPSRGLDFITEKQASKFFWVQMLMGDNGDNIKGIKGVGKKTALKILEGVTDYEKEVKETYKKYYEKEWEQEFKTNYLLLKLGVKYR